MTPSIVWLWPSDAGIAVVVSVGIREPMTLGAPANVYVITVGAMTDAYTPGDMADDYVAPFSSFGPTLEGFAKPEIVAPGGHLLGLVPDGSTLSKTRASLRQKDSDYLISGTSKQQRLSQDWQRLLSKPSQNSVPTI